MCRGRGFISGDSLRVSTRMSDTRTPSTTETDDEDDGDVPDPDDVDTAHLDDVADGCGCAEVWEHLSAERDEE